MLNIRLSFSPTKNDHDKLGQWLFLVYSLPTNLKGHSFVPCLSCQSMRGVPRKVKQNRRCGNREDQNLQMQPVFQNCYTKET